RPVDPECGPPKFPINIHVSAVPARQDPAGCRRVIEVNRRTALKTGGAVAAMLTSSGLASAAPTGGSGGSDVFRHGVASGDPLPHRVLLWTRVTPEPAATPGSGRGRETRVDWEIATDQQFRHVAAHGSTTTGPWRDHTVKID